MQEAASRTSVRTSICDEYWGSKKYDTPGSYKSLYINIKGRSMFSIDTPGSNETRKPPKPEVEKGPKITANALAV